MNPTRTQINQAILMNAPDKQKLVDKLEWAGQYRKPREKPNGRPEEEFQITCMDYLKLFPDIEAWAVPNQVARVKNTNEGAFLQYLKRLRDIGVKKGVSDIHIFFNGTFCVFECKAGYNKPDDDQTRYMQSIVAKGGYASWGNKLEDLTALLKTAKHPRHI
jgi:hypothetical protein